MKKRTKLIVAGASVLAVAAAASARRGHRRRRGPGRGARHADQRQRTRPGQGGGAREHRPGHCHGTEVGDEESYYEVEVTLDDGSQVDVQLDRHFNVVGSSADGETGSAADEPGGD